MAQTYTTKSFLQRCHYFVFQTVSGLSAVSIQLRVQAVDINVAVVKAVRKAAFVFNVALALAGLDAVAPHSEPPKARHRAVVFLHLALSSTLKIQAAALGNCLSPLLSCSMDSCVSVGDTITLIIIYVYVL